jgi:hypothetical protein
MKEIHQNYGGKEGEDSEKEESGDRNGTWFERCNCCGGKETDS